MVMAFNESDLDPITVAYTSGRRINLKAGMLIQKRAENWTFQSGTVQGKIIEPNSMIWPFYEYHGIIRDGENKLDVRCRLNLQQITIDVRKVPQEEWGIAVAKKMQPYFRSTEQISPLVGDIVGVSWHTRSSSKRRVPELYNRARTVYPISVQRPAGSNAPFCLFRSVSSDKGMTEDEYKDLFGNFGKLSDS